VSIPGRKRKFAHREPNGRLSRMAVHELDKFNIEKLTVLSQPHRRGELEDQKQESPLGRFVIQHSLPSELYDAALEYAGMVRCFYAARLPAAAIKGIPQLPADDRGSGNGVSPEKAVWLEKELSRIEAPLKTVSLAGFSALRMLAVHEREIALGVETAAANVLYHLAIMLKRVGGRR